MFKEVMLVVFIFSSTEGTYFSPIAYTLPDGLQSVSGSSSTGGCEERCIMVTVSANNGCDCPGTNPARGVLIDGDIPSIDTRQSGTWASELFTVSRNGRDSIIIGFQFMSNFYLREIEIVLFHCPVQGVGITGVNVYSSFAFPDFNSAASTLLITHSSLPSDNCQSLSTISIPVQPMESSEHYFIEFLFTGGSSVHQPSWLYLGEIRFSDMDVLSFTTTTTTTEYMTSSTASSERQTTTTNRDTPITHIPDETMSQSGLGHLEPTLGSTDVPPIPITSIVGGLVGIIAVLLLLVIIGGTFIVYLVVLHRRNIKSDSPLEHHYAAVGNPNINNAPSLEFQHLSNPGGEERRSSTAINSLYEPTTETSDHASSNTLSASVHVPGDDVIYSEIRDIPGVHSYSESIAEEQAQDTNGVDLYDDDDDDNHENHYAIIPEMYMMATPINQVKLNARPKSADVSQTAASLGCVSEAQNQESKEKYSLVHKQSECPPPVPEKSTELQQYLTVKVTAATEERISSKSAKDKLANASESRTQIEYQQ